MTGLQSVTDLTTHLKKTTGQIPPSLVGSTCTLVGDKVFVFGGRLATRQITNHLYILDLSLLEWQHHLASPDSARPPAPRYFHSATVYQSQYIVYFGGLGEHSTLNDISLFNTVNLTWMPMKKVVPSLFTPRTRYAHVALMITPDRLVVLGGQDDDHAHIDEFSVLDMKSLEWQHGDTLRQPCGMYRTVPFNHNSSLYLLDNNEAAFIYTLDPSCTPQHLLASSSPGFRFPQGDTVGHHLVVAGICLESGVKMYQIWVLHLGTMDWKKIDTGLTGGAWHHGLNYNNQWIFFGHQHRDLEMEYAQRQLYFDDLACLDLEAFGVYKTPSSNPLGRDMGLSMLKEPNMADVYVMTKDGQTIPANAHILSLRWPYAATLFRKTTRGGRQRHQQGIGHTLLLHETYVVGLAFIQYIYTDHLQPHPPSILARLLLLGDIHRMPRLKILATDALHQILNLSTASLIYEAATLTNQSGLQIRSLRVMLHATKERRSTYSSFDTHDELPSPTLSKYSHPDSLPHSLSSAASDPKEDHAKEQVKFSWRRLQQSTIALAKPKPLRLNAAHSHQPFYDL